MITKFLNYVEIKTKITSTLTFFLAIVFLMYKGVVISWGLTLIFFISMFVFDLTTTAINNYIDTKTNHQVLQFSRPTSLKIICVLFAISTLSGLILAIKTDLVVLVVGGICFVFGVFYTYGPAPISRQPVGEFFSGLFYGLFIPFLIFYINIGKGYIVSYTATLDNLSINIDIREVFELVLFAIIPFCVTAAIMLANNICDLEHDVKVNRFTLPFYIKNKSLVLFAGLYYFTYLSVIAMVFLKMISPISLIALITIIPVQRNLNVFFKKQIKEETFIVSIKNFVIIMVSNTLLIGVSVILK